MSTTSSQAPRVVVLGLGYVGLPLAVRAAEAGFAVTGFDPDEAKIDSLHHRVSYVEDIADDRPGLSLMRATSRTEDVSGFDIAVVTVPTPLRGGAPDLSYVEDAASLVGQHLTPGALVVLESTTYPGTTENLVAETIRRVSGLQPGIDYDLGFSPERIDPGNSEFRLENTPKIVSATTGAGLARVEEFYGAIVEETVPVSSPKVAELAKLLENTFRHVNIALVNEMAMLAHEMGIDVWEAIDAAATKPFGFMRFEPGPGMGGHCLPVDPFYLAFKAREYDFPTEFVELAGKINVQQPHFCVERVVRALNDVSKPVRGSRVLLLGVSYKAGVGDLRESPAVKIAHLLRELGGDVSYHDPHVAEVAELGLRSVPLDEALASCDVACVVTAHPEVDHAAVVAAADLVVDFRGVTRGIEAANLVRL